MAVSATVQEALITDLIFDTLSNLRSRSAFCVRPDCQRLFQKDTKHERKYCSSECAHIESVRKFRERKKKLNVRKRR